MKRVTLLLVVSIVVVGVAGSMAAMQTTSAPLDQPLAGKAVVLVKGRMAVVYENPRFESIGQHSFIVVLAKPGETEANYDLWIPLGDVTRLMVFDSKEDALTYQNRREQAVVPPSTIVEPRDAPDSPTASSNVPERFVKYAVSLITRYDTNKDGVLTEDEWQKMKADYSSADTDKDGRITPVEMGAALIGRQGTSSDPQSAVAEAGTKASPDAKLVWQECKTGPLGYSHSLHRAKVPGGWLVVLTPQSSGDRPASLTFYPDPQHVWDGTSLD